MSTLRHRRVATGALVMIVLATCASCSTSLAEPDPNDSRKLLELVVTQAAKKFANGVCLERKLLADYYPADDKWVEDKGLGIRYRERRVAPLRSIPADASRHFQITNMEYGCPETLRIHEPSFTEISDKGGSMLVASVKIDHTCGPICGEVHVANFTFKDGEWKSDGPIESTGVAM